VAKENKYPANAKNNQQSCYQYFIHCLFSTHNAKLTGRQAYGRKPSQKLQHLCGREHFKKCTAVGGRVKRLVRQFY